MNATEILEAWNASIRQKSEHPLAHFLHDDCKIEYFGRSQIHSKDEHLKWCRENTKAKCIGNFRVIYDDNGLCCGSHTVTYVSRGSGLIMFFGQYSDAGVTNWTSLVSRDWG